MPDAITPVGAMVQPPNALGTLSSIMGIQQQRQNLQTGAFRQQTAQAESQQAQQENNEKQALATYTRNAAQDPSYLNQDGSPNVQKYQQGAMAVAPVYGQAYIGQMTSNFNGLVENRRALLGLSKDQRATAGNYFGAVASMPGANQQDFLNAAKLARQVSPDQGYQDAVDRALIMAPKVDGMPTEQASLAIRQHARLIAMGAQAPDTEQSNIPAASMVQTRAGLTPTNVSPQAPMQMGPVGPTMENAPPPSIVTFPNQQLGYMGGGAGGMGGGAGGNGWNRLNTENAPQSKLPAMTRPGPNAPKADQDNYQRRISQLGDEYQAVSTAATDPMNGVNATRYRNQRVLDLAPHAATGPGLKALNVIASRLPGASGDAYQDLGHYTAQNSAALAKLMGVPNTNLGAETAAAAAGNVERNPGALMEITRANDALNTGFDLYNRGLARVTNNGSDMSRAAAYKQAFGQNVDVNALRWADAHRRGDQEEIAALNQKYGAAGIAAFQKRLQVLKALAEKGDVQ